MAKTIVRNASVIFRPTDTAVRYLRCRIGVAAQPRTYHYYYYYTIVERDVFASENEVAAAGPPDERMRSLHTAAPLRPPTTGPAARASYDDDIIEVQLLFGRPSEAADFLCPSCGLVFIIYFSHHLPPHTYADAVCTCSIIIVL